MLRKLLLLLALLVLVVIGLIYMGIIHWPGGSQVEVRPVDVSLENRDVNLQLPVPVIAPSGQPAGAQPAPSQPAQSAPSQPAPAQPQPQPAPPPQQ